MATRITTHLGNKPTLKAALREAEQQANEVLTNEKFVAMQTTLSTSENFHQCVITLVTEYGPEDEAAQP